MEDENNIESYFVVYLEDWSLSQVFEPNDVCWHDRKPSGRRRVLLVLAATFPHYCEEAELVGYVVIFYLIIEIRGERFFVVAHMR